MGFKCTKCSEEFEKVGVFVGHYRHKHTDYEARMNSLMKDLRKVKSMTHLQRQLMAKQQARFAIEEEIEAQIKQVCGKVNK